MLSSIQSFYKKFTDTEAVSIATPLQVSFITPEKIVDVLETVGAYLVIDNPETKRSCIITTDKISIIDTETLNSLCGSDSKYTAIDFTKLHKQGVYDKYCCKTFLNGSNWRYNNPTYFLDPYGKQVLYVFLSQFKIPNIIFNQSNKYYSTLELYDYIYSDIEDKTLLLSEFIYPKKPGSSFGTSTSTVTWYSCIEDFPYITNDFKNYKNTYRLFLNTKTLKSYKKRNNIVIYFNTLHGENKTIFDDNLLLHMLNNSFDVENLSLFGDMISKLNKYNPKFINMYKKQLSELSADKKIFSVRVNIHSHKFEIDNIFYDDLSGGNFIYDKNKDDILFNKIIDFLHNPDNIRVTYKYSSSWYRLYNFNVLNKDLKYKVTYHNEYDISSITIKQKNYKVEYPYINSITDLDVVKDIIPQEDFLMLQTEYALKGGAK